VEKRKLERNSGSISLNIPYRFAKICDLHPGDYVKVELTLDHKITIEKDITVHGEPAQCQQ
jgi:antitoxin component of MazEF toxin-antitoxin module